MPQPKYVRVKRTVDGAHVTITEAFLRIREDEYTVIDRPALNRNGLPAAPKFPVQLKTPRKSAGEAAPAINAKANEEAK